MFTEEQEIEMNILNDGRVNLTIIKNYLKDGIKVGSDCWGCCLEPHPAYLEYAKQILNDHYFNIVKTAWTDEVIELYQQKIESDQATFKGGF